MASELHHPPNTHYSDVRYRIVSLICLTLFYGLYLCLVPIAIHVMVTNGLQSRSRKWILGIVISMFALSTVYWILSVVLVFVLFDSWGSSLRVCYDRVRVSNCIVHVLARQPRVAHLPLFDDILLINFLIADGILVWRAWVLCPDKRRLVLMAPVVLLGINTIIYLMTVVIRAEIVWSEPGARRRHLKQVIKGTQLAHQTLSLFVNIAATSIIAFRAWRFRRFLMESGIDIGIPTRAARVLGLLIESGVIYILIGAAIFVSHAALLCVGLGVVNDVLMPVGTQLVGIYPIVVILLVEKNRSLNSEFRSFGTTTGIRGIRPSQIKAISFNPEPAPGSHIYPATKSLNTDIHVTFDSVLGPADAGTVHLKESVKSAATTRGDALRRSHSNSLPTPVYPAVNLNKPLPEIRSS